MRNILIDRVGVGPDHRPLIIAEMSANHNQSLDRALEIVRTAAAAGAGAIKLQTYTPDTMTMPGVKIIDDAQSLWQGRELYDLYQEAYTPWEWHKPIFDLARSLNMIAFSTPFDESAVDFLETLNVGAYKVASFENTDWPLLKKIARTGKPVIMSTGAASLADLAEGVDVLKTNGCRDLILLKCTSTYPSTPENSNLNTIPHLRQLFDCQVGLSDHTMGIGVGIAAVAMGATVIEKHFTLRRADGGVDSAFSIEPDELKSLVIESERAFLALGSIQYGIQESEKKNTALKRSLYVVKDVKAGEVFSPENIRVIRPSDGMKPKFYDVIIGRKASRDIKKGTALTWELL